MYCDCVQSFLENFKHYLEEKINFQVTFTKKTFILGILGKSKDILNIIFLWLKYYIYTARCTEKQLSVRFAMSFLKLFFETQKFIVYKNVEIFT